MTRVTVDLQDRLEEIADRLEDITTDADGLDESSQRYQELSESYRELAKAQHTIESCVEDWDGSEFTIKEFDWGDQALVNDRVRSEAASENQDDVRGKLGALKIHTVQVGVTATPPDAPDHARDFPPVVGEYLHERIDDLNRFGEGAGLEDFSLSAALNEDD